MCELKHEAKKLIDKYWNMPIEYLYNDTQDGCCLGHGNMLTKSAAKFAILEIDNMLEFLEKANLFKDLKTDIEHFKQLKDEIIKLEL